MKCKSFELFFRTFANRTRAKIVEALLEKPLSVSEISKLTGDEQSKISHNLKILKDCQIINSQIKGKHRIYSLNKKTMLPLMKLVEKHVASYCCGVCQRK